MSRSPNSEQKIAIESNGGLLLQAGAGSGKTFVIIEHVIHKISDWIRQHKQVSATEDKTRFLKKHLSSTVLMTFTNLAAGEMAIRLENRIKELMAQSGEDQEYWREIFRLSHMMNITTIHGFCNRLINQGFFKNINRESKLISEDMLKLFIKEQLGQWLVKQIQSATYPRALLDRVLLNRNNFEKALLSILSDSVALQLWEQGDDFAGREVWTDLCLFQSSVLAFEPEVLNEKHAKSKWGEFMQEFHSKFSSVPQTETEFKQLVSFFQTVEFKIPVARFANDVPEHIRFKYCAIRDLKDFIKGHSESFDTYWNQAQSWQDWDQIFSHIVRDMIATYSKTNFMTYTDMEYLVWKGLKDSENQLRIGQRYHYLIVDEFQDTSQMQYEIILAVVGQDLKKLFLVGDLKQAIYGFRGGEIGVFQHCIKTMPQVHALKTNYRSGKSIVDFNNKFFEHLFNKSFRDNGREEQKVTVEEQASFEQASLGNVTLLQGKVEELLQELPDKSLNAVTIDQLEAKIIRQYICSSQVQEKGRIAVLYRKLAPSKYLMDELAEHGIGFTTQVKIQLNQDPILAIFKLLVEGLLDSGGKHLAYGSLVLGALLNQLRANELGDLKVQLNMFYNNVKYFGLKSAFTIFLQNLHLSIPNTKESLGTIEQLIEHSGGDFESVYIAMNELLQKKYNLQLKFGENPDRVTLMTTHASKGLQYPKVVVAGIYTNDKIMINHELIGKLPGSFQWTRDQMTRQKYKSPVFIWEHEFNKTREFHESKRLFYVACTRAEQDLVMVDFDFGEVKARSGSQSWASFLKEWLDLTQYQLTVIPVTGKISLTHSDQIEVPLFHSNNLGIVGKLGADNHSVVMSELSATRLVSLAQCPKKFYFQNICKFEENNLDSLFKEGAELEELQGPISGKKRGIKVHQTISDFISSGFRNFGLASDPNASALPWLASQLSTKVEQHEFFAEKLIKFSFFGQMMTAIPDLYIVDTKNNRPIEIWDFKTGHQDEYKNQDYFYQLKIYLAALASIYPLPDDYLIKLVICYVDDRKMLEQNVDVGTTIQELMQLWKQSQTPWIERKEHCHACNYKSICQI